eukprot:scaffold7948_cov286-Pinguiococcus_pyrenoidosus.AAC.2
MRKAPREVFAPDPSEAAEIAAESPAIRRETGVGAVEHLVPRHVAACRLLQLGAPHARSLRQHLQAVVADAVVVDGEGREIGQALQSPLRKHSQAFVAELVVANIQLREPWHAGQAVVHQRRQACVPNGVAFEVQDAELRHGLQASLCQRLEATVAECTALRQRFQTLIADLVEAEVQAGQIRRAWQAILRQRLHPFVADAVALEVQMRELRSALQSDCQRLDAVVADAVAVERSDASVADAVVGEVQNHQPGNAWKAFVRQHFNAFVVDVVLMQRQIDQVGHQLQPLFRQQRDPLDAYLIASEVYTSDVAKVRQAALHQHL